MLAGVWYAAEDLRSTLLVKTTTPRGRPFATLTQTGTAESPYIDIEFEALSQETDKVIRESERISCRPGKLEEAFEREAKRARNDSTTRTGEFRLHLCAMASTYLVVGLSLSETRWLSP